MGKERLNENDLMFKLTLPPDMQLDPSQVEMSVVGGEGEEGMGDEMGGEVEMGDLEDPSMAGGSEVEDMGAVEPEMEGGGVPGEEMPEMEYEMHDDMMENKGIDDLFENLNDDDVIEIDENMLRRELARLSKMSEGSASDPKVLDDFGGAKAEMEPFVDADDNDLNVNADKDREDPSEKTQSESRVAKQISKLGRDMNALKRENAEYKSIVNKLRKQLTETNLFNAKLLYTNKLLQNKGITPQQKIAIVEALDKAETLREVKFLYQSLTKSLGTSLSTQKKISEGKVVPAKGNPSKVVKPAGVSQGNAQGKVVFEENDQSKRWATLAGIIKE